MILEELVEDMVGGDRERTSATIEEEDRALPRQKRSVDHLRLVTPDQPGEVFCAAVEYPPAELLHLRRLPLCLAQRVQPIRAECLRGATFSGGAGTRMGRFMQET